ncbi:MAG: hypothetical protein Q9166_005286 [cf. Caloplaca sp. 2 TL-2023]
MAATGHQIKDYQFVTQEARREHDDGETEFEGCGASQDRGHRRPWTSQVYSRWFKNPVEVSVRRFWISARVFLAPRLIMLAGTRAQYLLSRVGKGLGLRQNTRGDPVGCDNGGIIVKMGSKIDRPPDPETEEWATYLATHIIHSKLTSLEKFIYEPLRILDLCTGTGCIPLLLYSLLHLHYPSLHITGVDISPSAVRLARLNLRHNISRKLLPASASAQVQFFQGDVFAEDSRWRKSQYDVVISNPPYVTPEDYNHTITRSVRNHEPKLALVPKVGDTSHEAGGDAFYPSIFSLAEPSNTKMIAVEVGGMQQAERVAEMVGKRKGWRRIEIWRDGVLDTGHSQITTNHIGNVRHAVCGTGEGRAVVVWR